jgi:uncharacterized protein (TIGR03084 family)
LPTDLGPLLADLRAEHDDLLRLVRTADLATPTPADGWDVRDAVSHLMGSDREAHKAATDPERFLAELVVVAADIAGFLAGQLEVGRRLSPAELLDGFESAFTELLDALAGVPTDSRIPWYGPPMSAASMTTARLMEYWAHGQDVADGLGVTRPATARLRHICHLGVRTRAFAYANRGLPVPDGPVAVALVAPDGSTWAWGEGEDRVEGLAEDFCLLVTQRRHRDDVDLVATGDAEEWLRIAQCFAGPPGPGRAKR